MHRAANGIIFLFVASVSSVLAQQADTGGAIAVFEAGGMFGAGAHGAVGASLAAPLSRHFLPFIDFSYSPLSSYAYTYGTNNTGKALYRSGLVDANGGLKIRFPGKSDWVPYIGFGAGVLHFSSSTDTSGFGSTATINQSHSELAGNASAGALYYATQHFGFTMEVKGYASQRHRFARAIAGVFYQF